jgi:hypothetical protein
MKVWVLHDDDKDGNIYGIHGVTSDPAVAKLWETEYEYYKADAFEIDDMRVTVVCYFRYLTKRHTSVYAAGVRPRRGGIAWSWARSNGPQFWTGRKLLLEAGFHPKIEVSFGRYRVDLLLRGLPRRLKRSHERSKGKLRLFGRRIGRIPHGHFLAIEIDGPHHDGNRDAQRDEYFAEASQGICGAIRCFRD